MKAELTAVLRPFGAILLAGALTGCEPGGAGGKTATPTLEPASAERDAHPMVVPLDFEVHGHRGARGLRPENTLPAFEAALDLQVTALELDLHFTRDRKVVVWHDPFVTPEFCGPPKASAGPAAGAPPIAATDPGKIRLTPDDVPLAPEGFPPLHPSLAIRNQSAAQLRPLRCDRNAEPMKFLDQKPIPGPLSGDDWGIVTLEELVDFVAKYAASDTKSPEQRANAAKVVFNIETKRWPNHPSFIGDGFDGEEPGPFEREVVRVLRSRDLLGRAMVQSFDHRSLWAIRKLEPELVVAVLERERGPEPLAKFAENGAKAWSPRHSVLTPELVAEAKAAGLLVVPWTVNEAFQMSEMRRLGVDGLITDRPDLLERRAEAAKGGAE